LCMLCERGHVALPYFLLAPFASIGDNPALTQPRRFGGRDRKDVRGIRAS